MRAALYRTTGAAAEVLELTEIERPDPGPGEVRVRMVRSGINATDWKTRAGLTNRLPDGFQVPHQDGSGVVAAIGPGVTGLAVGQRVWVFLAAFGNRYGTAAPFAVLPSARVAPLPDAASFDLGACLGVPALTAAHCLGGRPAAVAGRTVLVAGGAGGVGHYAIQLAKHAGARVVATVSTDAKAALARAAGADHVVRYTDPDAAEQIVAAAGRVDRVVEVAISANLELDLAVAATGATIASYAAAGEMVVPVGRLMAENLTLSFTLLYGLTAHELADGVAWTVDALEAGALTALDTLPYPLERIVDAHLVAETAPVGKVLLTIDDPETETA